MAFTKAYVALGGNVGDARLTIASALRAISSLQGTKDLEVSKLYWTTPVSNIAQDRYVNGVCRFLTPLSAIELLYKLQEIQRQLGQQPKPKEAPRLIDLDILFFGSIRLCTPELTIPHPEWRKRLFVLIPLKDLVSKIELSDKTIAIEDEIALLSRYSKECVEGV